MLKDELPKIVTRMVPGPKAIELLERRKYDGSEGFER